MYWNWSNYLWSVQQAPVCVLFCFIAEERKITPLSLSIKTTWLLTSIRTIIILLYLIYFCPSDKTGGMHRRCVKKIVQQFWVSSLAHPHPAHDAPTCSRMIGQNSKQSTYEKVVASSILLLHKFISKWGRCSIVLVKTMLVCYYFVLILFVGERNWWMLLLFSSSPSAFEKIIKRKRCRP